MEMLAPRGRIRTIGLLSLLIAVALASTGCTRELIARNFSDDEPTGDKQQARTMEFQLASQTGKVAVNVPAKPAAKVGTTTGGVELEVYTLDRADSVVNVVVAVHNSNDEEVKALGVLEGMDEAPEAVANLWDASNVSIVDPKGLKEYRSFLAEGKTGPCLCSVTWMPNTKDFAPAERRFYVTQVAAPPAEVTKVTVLTGIASVPNVSLAG